MTDRLSASASKPTIGSAIWPTIWPVLVFWLLACGISWPFMFMATLAPETWQSLPLPPPLKATLFMWGPGIAALVCYRIFRERITRRTTLLGSSRRRSVVAVIVPALMLATLVFVAAEPKHALLFLALMVPVGLFNTLGEELGWRGYLQDAMPLDMPWQRYLAVGVVWELWHVPMRLPMWQDAPLNGVMIACGTLGISLLAGYAVRWTNAVAFAVMLHFLANLAITGEMLRMFDLEPVALYLVAAASAVLVLGLAVTRTGSDIAGE